MCRIKCRLSSCSGLFLRDFSFAASYLLFFFLAWQSGLIFRFICKIMKSKYQLHHVCLSVCPSVYFYARATWLPRNGNEILYLRIFQNSVDKIQVSLKYDRITGTLHEDQYIFFTISRSFLLRMRNVSCKSCRENQTRVLCSVTIFRKSCRL